MFLQLYSYLISPHLISPHLISPHLISPHLISSHQLARLALVSLAPSSVSCPKEHVQLLAADLIKKVTPTPNSPHPNLKWGLLECGGYLEWGKPLSQGNPHSQLSSL